MAAQLTLDHLAAGLAATTALGAAAAGLVDASKAIAGGVRNVGFGAITRGCAPFAGLMQRGAGPADWRHLLRAHWINGRSPQAQVRLARTLVRLGLGSDGASMDAVQLGVATASLEKLVARLRAGDAPDDADTETLARIDARIGLAIEAAYAIADQRYRTVARMVSGLAALALALLAGAALSLDLVQAAIIGLIALPLAPLIKDLISSLSVSARAVKAARRED